MSKKTVKKTVKNAPAKIVATETVSTIMIMAETNWVEKHVKPGANAENKETSRAKFMRHVARWDGLPWAEWNAACAKKMPATPPTGKAPYTAKQWMTWFVKAGVVELHDA